jgi:putative ABC transport system permease protein
MLTGHYLHVAWANLRRTPAVTAVSVFTLTLGLLAFLATFGVVRFWESADRHFANAERTYVMTSAWRVRAAPDDAGFAQGPMPRTNQWLAEYLREDFPQIDAVARVIWIPVEAPVRAGDGALRTRLWAADGEFLDIFDLPFVAGDSHRALREPASAVLTRETAERLFGNESALGRSIELYTRIDVIVTGVIDAIPEPSHMGRSLAAPLAFDVLVSRDVYERLYRERFGRESTQAPEDWYSGDHVTYVLLPADGALTARALRRQLPAFTQRRVPAAQLSDADIRLDLVPLSALLGDAIDGSLFLDRSGVSASRALLTLGAIVLAVACLNFANLATAVAIRRAREVGLRKAIGARRSQLIAQFLLEAALLTAAAFALALSITIWLRPVVETSTGIDIGLALFDGWRAWFAIVVLLTIVTVLAGAWPAFALSRLSPESALKGAQQRVAPAALAMWLVGVQFCAAAFLLIAVAVTHLQNRATEGAPAAFGADRLLVIDNASDVTGIAQATLREQLLSLPQLASATTLGQPPWTNASALVPLTSSPSLSTVERTAIVHQVGTNFFSTLGIGLLAGRVFDPGFAADVAATYPPPHPTQHVVISRALAEEFGFESPTIAVEQLIWVANNEPGSRPWRIIGVVEDRPLAISSPFGPRPAVYLYIPESRFHIARMSEGVAVVEALAAVDQLWQRLAPDIMLEPRLAVDFFEASYAYFALLNQAFAVLAVLAILIATGGLVAMSLLIVNRRLHEIGVRKTLGAGRHQIVAMLLRGFSAPILIANIVAWPLAWLAASTYLSRFIAPVALTPMPFLAALLASLLICWIAVGGQTVRAARISPARVLRQE